MRVAEWHRVGKAYGCAPAKCGSTSLRRAGPFKAFRTPPNDGRPRYLAVRDPIERFISLCRQVKLGGELRDLQRATPEQVMHAVETTENRHWTRLCDHLIPDAIPVPLPLFLPVLGLPPRRDNVGNREQEIVPGIAILTRLRAHYAADLELYAEACHRFGHPRGVMVNGVPFATQSVVGLADAKGVSAPEAP